MDINDEWQMFLSSDLENEKENEKGKEKDENNKKKGKKSIPIPSDLYISTKTNIAFLKQRTQKLKEEKEKEIDILSVFWNVPIISYEKPMNGIVKKQILIKSETEEELQKIKKNLQNIKHYDELIIISINNPNGRVKFKDTRKISVGLCKRDIISFRCKQKSAFDNCVAFIMRLKIEDIFREFHVKLFNTGKIEIPGVKEQHIFDLIIENLIEILNPYVELYLLPIRDNSMEVLINSNFNCGFYIKRDVLYKILKYDYNIPTIYDPCMYPGIQCKYSYEIKNDDNTTTQKKVSFMIFRTGSVLIMGKCKESILYEMYEFVSNLLIEKYDLISQGNIEIEKNNNFIKMDDNDNDKKEFLSKTNLKKNKKKIVMLNK